MSEDEIGVDVVIENEEGSIDIQSDVLKGDKGDKGDPTATIEINQVLTGEAGTEVSIDNIGTDVNMRLNITIPRGEIGTPVVYNGTFEDLKNSKMDKKYNYIILDSTDNDYEGHWVYYDWGTEEWKDGGLYLSYQLTSEIKERLDTNDLIIEQNTLRQDTLEQKYDEQNAEIDDARSGFDTLGNVIKQKIYHFENIETMKNNVVLKEGDVVQTLGYYEENDGGSAKYKIVNDSSLTDDGGSVHDLSNGLKAKLVIEGNLNVKQFGAKGDGTADDTIAIQNAINFASKGDNIYFPNGNYLAHSLVITKRLNLIGQSSTTIVAGVGTTITFNGEETSYLFNIYGTKDVRLVGSSIKNINFNGNMLKATSLVSVKYAQFFNFTECSFNNVNGSALQFACAFESGIYKSVFRRCGNETNGVVDFLNYTDSVLSNNTNNFHIENCTFGYNSGNWIKCEDNANTDILWIKNNKFEWDGTPAWANENEQAVIYLGQIFRCFIKDNTFTYFTLENNKYTKIIECNRGSGIVSILNNKVAFCNSSEIPTTFITSTSPVILSDKNIIYDSSNAIDINVQSSQSIHMIKPTKFYANNGSLSNVTKNIIIPKSYISSLDLVNTMKNTLVYDENSINYTKQVKQISANQRIGFLNPILFKNYFADNIEIKIRAKKQTDDTSNPSILIYKTGESGDTNIANSSITINSSTWNWYTISIPKSEITEDITRLFLLQNNSTVNTLIDGIILPF